MTRKRKPKPFVDFLPDWITEIDMEDRLNYRYAWAVKNYHRIQESRAMFPDAVAWGTWVFTDRTNVEPTVRVPCAQYATGGSWWRPSAEEAFTRQERYADGTFRWQVGFSSIDEYSPESPAVLAERAARRQTKKDAAERAAMPLFADQVREEQLAAR